MRATVMDTNLRRVVIGAITSSSVCALLSQQWSQFGLFDTAWANVIVGWCVEFWRRYGQAPGGNLEGLFQDWLESANPDEGLRIAVDTFLSGLDDQELTRWDESYLLDLTKQHIARTKIQKAIADAEAALDRNDIDQARRHLAAADEIGLSDGSLVKPGESFKCWREAFDVSMDRQLVRYPGPLDKFLGDAMVKGAFVSFMGPDKIGKSYVLLDLAYRAVRNGCRVAFFDTGDMTRSDVLKRLGCRAAGKPLKPGKVRYPVRVADGEVIYKTLEFKEGLTDIEAFRAFQKATRNGDRLRICNHPNGTISIAGIANAVQCWIREEGWKPDVLVVDYADILAPVTKTRDVLESIDETWRYMRRVSQEYEMLVVTATQSSALAYKTGQQVLGKRHFSGRKTKLAHVTGMVGLNSFQGDSTRGIIRFNWIVRRDRLFSEGRIISAAGCLALSRPVVLSWKG